MHVINIIGAIDTAQLQQVVDSLEQYDTFEQPCELVVRISSEGGGAETGLAIAGMLRRYDDVVTEVYGECSSAATVIFAAGHRRRIQKWAMCMVHESSEDVSGTASAIKHHAKNMEKLEAHWNSIFQELTGTDAKAWEKLNERDTYLTAEDCLKLNLATEIF